MTALELLLESLNDFVNEPVANNSQFDYGKGMNFAKSIAQERIKFTLKQYQQFAKFEKELEEIRAYRADFYNVLDERLFLEEMEIVYE